MFWTGFRRDLEVDDLYKPLNEHKSSLLGEKISKAWEEEVEKFNKKQTLKEKDFDRDKNNDVNLVKNQPSLLKVLIKCFGFQIILYGILLAVMEIVLR